MTHLAKHRPSVNILSRYSFPLFTQHFEAEMDGYDVVENGSVEREWDLIIAFEAITAAATYRVREGGAIFVSGEPPEAGSHRRAFLRQFDAVYCAGAPANVARDVSQQQHFNNWHFGYSGDRKDYRYDHRIIRTMPPPRKTITMSTVTSNLNYLPMHIKRRALIERLAHDYPDQIDIFGRPHRYVEYKEDAILPYRFHLCVENCALPGLWTEKIADPLLGYAIPVYAGCPDIESYFPGASIAIDLDDYASARRTIESILAHGEAIYQDRFDALVAARASLIQDFDMSSLIRQRLVAAGSTRFRDVTLKPEAEFSLARERAILARIRRKVTSHAWRRKVARHG